MTKQHNISSFVTTEQQISNDDPIQEQNHTSIGTGPSKSTVHHNNSEMTNTDVVIVNELDKVGLKRNLGVLEGVVVIAGTMIGSGIFISPTGVTAGAGSVGLAMISWCICGAIAIMGGLCIGELGTVVPESGAEYAYVKTAYGRIFAFLTAWISVILLKPTSLIIITLTCAKYIAVSFFQDGCGPPPDILVKMICATIVCVLCGINCFSVSLSSKISTIFCFGKVIALVIIIIGGFVRLGQGHVQYLAAGFENSQTNMGALAIGLYNGMWAYDGWHGLAYMTEELKNPARNLPRCIVIGVVLVTILYVFTNLSYFTAMSPEQLLASPAVAVTWADAIFPSISWVIPLVVVISTFGSANLTLMASSRMNFVAGRDGLMVNVLSMVHTKRQTPVPAILLMSLLGLFWTTPGDVGTLIDYFSFAVWTLYGMCMAALLILRVKLKDVKRTYKVPIVIPGLMCLICAFLVIAPIVQSPKIEQLYAFCTIISGLLFYVPFVVFKWKFPGMDYITIAVQLFFQVAPTPDFDNQ